MSTENLERISNGHGSTACTGGIVYNPSSAVVNLAEICTADNACLRKLSVSEAVTDRYREMEKRIEEQDRIVAELKGIIENLQDIVYRQKLDKEAETLVL